MAGNTQDKRVNDQKLRSLKDGETLTESLAGRGSGSILFRRQGSATTALYRYSVQKKSKYHTIGAYKSTPSTTGLMLAEIRAKARHLADLHKGYGDIKAHLTREVAKEEARLEAERIASESEAQKGSFADLLTWYVNDMRQRGRMKADQVGSMFKRHVLSNFPDLAHKSAREITYKNIAQILRTVRDSKPAKRGKGNTTQPPKTSMRSTTDSVHTYLSAAFQAAMKSMESIETDEDDIQASDFGITFNPAAAVKPLSNVYKGETESLEQLEMSALLKHLDALEERKKAIALSALYLGGQRLKMLMDTRWEDIDDDGMLMYDRKGREDPLLHFLPFTPRVREIMTPLLSLRTSAAGPFALTENLVRADYASKIFIAAGISLSDQGKTSPFTWQNVRATCETLMAGIGISEDYRAHVLSHGRSGVQAKFYDRNAYVTEKVQALDAWGKYLDELRDGKTRKGIKVLKLSELRGKQAKK
ncbi:tyrosine-type recombinase/integrase [Pseudomonas iridis]|uniref:Tyrosine-type recombinase/integrase n=1 Tax=Pseudomonas iridis TaxID=2710587 RepID=A0ABW8DKM9_9PSED